MNGHRPITAMLTAAQLHCVLEQLWSELTDIPMNPETERMDEAFLHFPPGTEREDILRWFDERYSRGIVNLLYGGDDDCALQVGQSATLKEIFPECNAKPAHTTTTAFVTLFYLLNKIPRRPRPVGAGTYTRRITL